MYGISTMAQFKRGVREWFIGEKDHSLINSSRNWNIDEIDPDQIWDSQGLSQIVPRILNQMVIIKQYSKEERAEEEEGDDATHST